MASLDQLYRSAIGKTFQGVVVDLHNIRGNKVWTVIQITWASPDLELILTLIRASSEGMIWKGFTGPPEFPYYRLWVEPFVNIGTTGIFTVIDYVGPFFVEDFNYTQHQGYCFIVG